MTDLSPAAFAVVHAFVCANARKTDPSSNADIAAALRALLQEKGAEIYDEDGWLVHFVVMQDDIRAIADELEGAS